MEFLSNPVWQLMINIAIGLLTIIVSITIYRKQQNRKGITYEIISNTSMLSFRNEVIGRVQILFDKKPIAYARLVILKIWNSGNVAIEPNQYSDPIKVHFGLTFKLTRS